MGNGEGTQYVLEVFFDEHTARYVRTLWERIDRAGYPSPLRLKAYEPHLTLLVLEDPGLEVDALPGLLYRGAQSWGFPVDLVYLGLFTEQEWLVFLGVVPVPELLTLHRRVYEMGRVLSRAIRPYFAPDLWVPHVTLSFDLTREQALEVLSLNWEGILPYRAWARGLRLVEVGPGHAREMLRAPFSGHK